MERDLKSIEEAEARDAAAATPKTTPSKRVQLMDSDPASKIKMEPISRNPPSQVMTV